MISSYLHLGLKIYISSRDTLTAGMIFLSMYPFEHYTKYMTPFDIVIPVRRTVYNFFFFFYFSRHARLLTYEPTRFLGLFQSYAPAFERTLPCDIRQCFLELYATSGDRKS